MPKLSRTQAIIVATLATVGLIYMAILVAAPVLEYLHGPSPETVLLHRLAGIGPAALMFVGFCIVILQLIGVIPTVKRDATQTPQLAAVFRLRNLAIWIVIALLLVFLFNLFQGTGKNAGHASNVAQSGDTLLGVILNWLPLLLLIGVWIFFLRQMRANKNRNPPDSPDP
jgi:hypothetical protein